MRNFFIMLQSSNYNSRMNSYMLGKTFHITFRYIYALVIKITAILSFWN